MFSTIWFYLTLWVSKCFLYFYKKTGREKDDRPGLLAMYLCPDFLERVRKPKLVVAVTGTNGKTTISNLVSDVLALDGKTVAYNNWGANCKAGNARLFLDAVDIFNRPTKDAAVVEADERLCYNTLPWMQPDYIIVTNICRDSVLRNAHQQYIFDRIEKGIAVVPKAKLILNADDPVSSFLGERLPNQRIYYGIGDQGTQAFPTLVSDFPVCPRCGSKPRFRFRHYRDIGQFVCPCCGLTSKESQYLATDIDLAGQTATVQESGTQTRYPLISDTIFNAYNIMALIALLRSLGMEQERLAAHIAKIHIPENRLTLEEAGGIQLYTFSAKGQNVSAASTVFEYIAKEPSRKELILLLDEHYGDDPEIELITWLYESDFEYLKQDNIEKIIVAGHRYLDYHLRLLLAGIPEEKIVCLFDENDILEHVQTRGVSAIYVLHDVYTFSKSRRIRDQIKERILREQQEVEA
ncbi:MAG TPA: DUF1727 domain-containing protein [Candidatus Faecousia intestinigallinarum]|nr:DUF1727 domain-containing protein [Candidatus Faecousia intestinigallinarum]